MKVIIKEPFHLPHQIVIDGSLDTLQQLVDGYIEHVNVSEDIGMLINEEGKLRGLQENFYFRGDMIVGTAIFVGYDGEDFTDVPVCVNDIRTILAREQEVR